MYNTDREAFTGLMQLLGKTFNKPVDEELCGSYWGALKDQPIGQIVACANTHMRFGKFFPKPFELRPKDDRPKVKHDDAALLEGERRANERLEALRKNDPDEWLRQVSPKVYEMGRARGMFDSQIAEKLQAALRRP